MYVKLINVGILLLKSIKAKYTIIKSESFVDITPEEKIIAVERIHLVLAYCFGQEEQGIFYHEFFEDLVNKLEIIQNNNESSEDKHRITDVTIDIYKNVVSLCIKSLNNFSGTFVEEAMSKCVGILLKTYEKTLNYENSKHIKIGNISLYKKQTNYIELIFNSIKAQFTNHLIIFHESLDMKNNEFIINNNDRDSDILINIKNPDKIIFFNFERVNSKTRNMNTFEKRILEHETYHIMIDTRHFKNLFYILLKLTIGSYGVCEIIEKELDDVLAGKKGLYKDVLEATNIYYKSLEYHKKINMLKNQYPKCHYKFYLSSAGNLFLKSMIKKTIENYNSIDGILIDDLVTKCVKFYLLFQNNYLIPLLNLEIINNGLNPYNSCNDKKIHIYIIKT